VTMTQPTVCWDHAAHAYILLLVQARVLVAGVVVVCCKSITARHHPQVLSANRSPGM
jgi:hypothetical protein